MLGSHASDKQFSEESVHSNPQVYKNFECLVYSFTIFNFRKEREKFQVFVMLQGDQVNSQASVNSHASVPLSQVGEENNYLRESYAIKAARIEPMCLRNLVCTILVPTPRGATSEWSL